MQAQVKQNSSQPFFYNYNAETVYLQVYNALMAMLKSYKYGIAQYNTENI